MLQRDTATARSYTTTMQCNATSTQEDATRCDTNATRCYTTTTQYDTTTRPAVWVYLRFPGEQPKKCFGQLTLASSNLTNKISRCWFVSSPCRSKSSKVVAWFGSDGKLGAKVKSRVAEECCEPFVYLPDQNQCLQLFVGQLALNLLVKPIIKYYFTLFVDCLPLHLASTCNHGLTLTGGRAQRSRIEVQGNSSNICSFG